MKKLLLATAAVLAMTPALAADLPIKTRSAAVAAMPWSWAGCFMAMEAGGNAGPNTDSSPAAAGAMGCNYQSGGLVYGFEMDAGAVKNTVPVGTSFGFVGDASVRVGYALSPNITLGPLALTNVLPYVKANLALADITTSLGQGMKTGPGFAVGLENVIAPNTTLGPEYRWYDVNGVKSNTYLMVMRVYGSPM